METGSRLEEVDTGHQERGSCEQVAVVNEHGETIYIQMPPNVTFDDNSIVTTETTEDGQQIFRVIQVTEQPDGPLHQDEDGGVLQDHQEMEDRSQEVMEAEEQEVTIFEPGDQEVTVMETGGQEVSIMDSGIQEVTVIDDDGQDIMVMNSEAQAVTVDTGHQEVTVMNDGDQEITVMEAAGQEVTVMEAAGQEVIVMEAAGQEVSAMEAAGHEVHIVESQGAGTHMMQGEQWVMARDALQVKSTPGVGRSSADNCQDLAVFQQALDMFDQQSEGIVVADGEDGNTVYIVQQPKEEVEAVAEMEQMATEAVELTETINIINPETGKVEAIAASCLDSSDGVSPVAELAAPTDVVGLTNLLPPDPIVICPVKRGRGRPRKDKSVPQPPRPPTPPPEEEKEVEPPDPGRRPRRKAAIKFFKKLAAMTQDLGVECPDPDAQRQPSGFIPPMLAAQLEEQQAAMEKHAQAYKEKKAQAQKAIHAINTHPAVVNVKIKDKTTLQVMSDIGIHMLYYCRRCTFFSTQIMVVTNHILACRQRTLTTHDQNQAADAAHTSALLVNAALQDIAKWGTENPRPGGEEEDLIQIDEHNYAAEVDGLEGEPTGVQCHLCSESVELEMLPEHLRNAHPGDDGEEAARTIEEVQEKQVVPGIEVKADSPVPDSCMEIKAEDIVMETPTDENTVVTHIAGDVEAPSDLHVNNEESVSLADKGSGGVAELDAVVASSRFRCPQHEVAFPNQAALTCHYIELHWGVTKEKIAATEVHKQKETEEQINNVPIVKKRGCGRPRKHRVIMKPAEMVEPNVSVDLVEDMKEELLSNHDDDDVKDPDFDVNTADDTSATAAVREKGSGAKCMHCYKRFATPTNLKLHMKHQHTGDKLLPVPCQYCDKYFKNKVQLRNHVRCVHEGLKRRYVYKHYPLKKKLLMCEECGYTTPELCRLKNHKLSVHEGQYPYVCRICDYKTNENADMRRHEHKHQGIKRYSCGYCSYRSDQRWLLVNHCQRQHAIRLDRQSRNTRGSFWSNRRTRKEETTSELPGGGEGDGQLPGADLAVVADPNAPIAYTQEIIIDQGTREFPENSGESYLVPMVTTNEHGEQEVTMYEVRHGDGEQEGTMYAIRQDGQEQDGAIYMVSNDGEEQGGPMYAVEQDVTEQEVAVETIEEEAHGGDVVYIQEDGTVLEGEQAAMMLLAVGPTSGTSQTDEAVHVETNYT